MNEYILFMHDDVDDQTVAGDGTLWSKYLDGLRQTGQFDGGSAIGTGVRHKKDGSISPVEGNPTGFIRVKARSLDDAKRFLEGNPVYDAGGTVEIRELPRGT